MRKHVPLQAIQPAPRAAAADPRVDEVDGNGGIKFVQDPFDEFAVRPFGVKLRFYPVGLYFVAIKTALGDAVAQKGDGYGGSRIEIRLLLLDFFNDLHAGDFLCLDNGIVTRKDLKSNPLFVQKHFTNGGGDLFGKHRVPIRGQVGAVVGVVVFEFLRGGIKKIVVKVHEGKPVTLGNFLDAKIVTHGKRVLFGIGRRHGRKGNEDDLRAGKSP